MRKILLFAFILIVSLSNFFASHIPGGNITYQCTGNPNEYIVTMTMFVSCPSSLSTSYTIQTNNDCGLASTSISLNQVGVATEVSQICDAQAAQSDCNTGGGGGIPGVMMYTYEATVTLPGACDAWTFYFDLCCRDQSTNMAGGSGNNLYIETTMNSTTAPCDNSIIVTAQPIPYVCAGQNITYCPGTIDTDGDSLYHQLIAPYGGSGTPIGYNAGYTNGSPLQNTVFDPSTGCMTFNQPTIGNFVVAYLIEAYDANGNLTGSIVHDFQFEVITCTNTTPTPPAGGINLVSGNANQTGPNTIELCEGSNACFSMTFNDADAGTVLSIDTTNSNIFSAFPGATITTTGTNPMTVDVCWTVPAGSPSQIIATTTVTDGACPIEGTATQVATFDVVTSTVANPDITICGNQTAQLSAAGGTIFNWQAISGDPITVGTNFSCNPCANPIATPSQTTTYVVTSNLSGGCDNIDTTTVFIVPDFSVTASQSSTTSCLFEPVQLNAAVAPAAAGYIYQWSPATYLNSTTIPNPVANITVPGVYEYFIDVTSPDGCLKRDSIMITVAAAVAPNINILTPDSLMQCGDSILVDLDLGGGIPAVCGPSATNSCSGPSTQTTIGTGTTNISNAPSPYYGFYEDGRIQMIFTAAEITAMGFIGGKITEISFDVTNKASTQPYSGLTIKIGPTALNDFNGATAFIPGLTQVYTNASYTTTLGVNTHILNTAYEWDGVSNLIVEVCFDNASWTSTDQVAQTNTGGIAMTLYDYTDGATGCILNTPYTASTARPNITFTQCPTIPDPNAYSYDWIPNTGISSSSIQNPTVYPNIPTSYIVTVTDTAGGCTDTDTLNINVSCGACFAPLPTTTNTTCKDGNDGKIVVDPVFVLGSEVQNLVWKDSITGTVLQTTNNITAGMQDSLVNITAGVYTIIMTDSTGCISDTTVTIYEPDSVIISNITTDDIICIDGSKSIEAMAISGNGMPYTYNWTDLSTNTPIAGNGPHTVNPIVSPTCYSVWAEDILGCISDTQEVCISLYPNILASSSNLDTTICPKTSVDIDMDAIGGSGVGYNYDWYESGNLIGNGSVINVTPTSPSTTYFGVATDNCSTPPDSVEIVVNWFSLPTPLITKDKQDTCYSMVVEFTNTSIPAALIGTSEWTIDGNTYLGSNANHLFTTPVCKDVSLKVTTINGCVVDTTYTNYVCPYPYPVADFYMTPPITDVLNTEIDFTNLSTGDSLSYLWGFDSGLFPDSSNATSPIFIYSDETPGTYNVTLVAVNQHGCADTTSGTVIINGIYLFYAPNAFTPDGDGLNEIFRPYGEGIDFNQYTMEIYDRWGELIYKTSQPELGWNGTYKGAPAPVGTYIWKIVAKEEYGTIIHDNYGHVSLIR